MRLIKNNSKPGRKREDCATLSLGKAMVFTDLFLRHRFPVLISWAVGAWRCVAWWIVNAMATVVRRSPATRHQSASAHLTTNFYQAAVVNYTTKSHRNTGPSEAELCEDLRFIALSPCKRTNDSSPALRVLGSQ